MGSFWPIKPAGRFTPESSGEVTIHASCNFGRMSMDQRYVSYKLTTLKLTAKDATVEDLQTLFGIDFDASRMESMPWQLRSEPYDVPRKLVENLDDLSRAMYKEASEAASPGSAVFALASRIAVDIMLVQCKLFLTELYPEHFSTKRKKTTTCPSTSGPQCIDSGQVVKSFPELEVYLDVEHPKTKKSIRVTGRADWGFGYGGRHVLMTENEELIVDTKYEIILSNFVDSYRFVVYHTVMSISTEGVIDASRQFYVHNTGDAKTIFNFVIAILESAIKSSPNVSPPKPAVLQEKEVGNYKKEVWDKIYLEGPKLPVGF
ncbi:hypothetical protein V8E54_009528 [Elaphomyces granulatus]